MTYEPRYLGATPGEILPSIYLTIEDCGRLRALIGADGVQVAPQVRRLLVREIERATLYANAAIPVDAVTMHSRIIYRRHPSKPREMRTLCYGDTDTISGPRVSVLTPLGAALLGLRCGTLMPYETLQGKRFLARVEAVPYQPQAHGQTNGQAHVPALNSGGHDSDPGPAAA